ncbi:hypothetical protein EC973_003166 [Apophysomyces ossiformis]|uniref:Uncharacterized protein n=1 Tax=Apophysomyces ossiformis TaxID=679940 RepID=A0A8H7BRI9_9FUNG|nr:hypothetical protein EC973_003166 [Apophysomyces ossiformis]
MTVSSSSNGVADEQTGLLVTSSANYTLEIPEMDQYDPEVPLDELTDILEELLMREGLKHKRVSPELYKHATNRWLDKHQYGVLGRYYINSQDAQDTSGLSGLSHEVWQVGKNASACALLALLAEQQQSGEKGNEFHEDFMQHLALSTVQHAIQQTADVEDVQREMLLKPWINGKSAIALAVENEYQIFLADQEISSFIEVKESKNNMAELNRFVQALWLEGRDWKHPKHPSSIWDTHRPTNRYETFFWLTSSLTRFLTRWAAARYQAYIGLFAGIVYFALQVATAANEDYVGSEPEVYEYVYYVFVVSDLLLELGKLFRHPIRSVETPSSYLSITASILAFAAGALRFSALASSDLEDQAKKIELSYILLTWATPLMAFRLFVWMDDLWWPVTKINYVLRKCFTNTLWAMLLSLAVLVAFWLGVFLLQRNSTDPLSILLYLALGELHAPQIGHTLIYKPYSAGVLLFAFLVLTVFIGALVTSSFLAVFIDIYPRLPAIKRSMEAQRSIREPKFGVFIPSVGIELLVFGAWLVVRPFYGPRKIIWLEKVRQVLWYIVFSPIVFAVGVVELLSWAGRAICIRWKSYWS